MGEYAFYPTGPTVEERSMSSRRDRAIGKLECFVRFDEVTYWLSRTRDLISSAETYSYPAFAKSFRQLRREARRSEFALVVALYRFKQAMMTAEPEESTD